jgi:hypothetical protein
MHSDVSMKQCIISNCKGETSQWHVKPLQCTCAFNPTCVTVLSQNVVLVFRGIAEGEGAVTSDSRAQGATEWGQNIF